MAVSAILAGAVSSALGQATGLPDLGLGGLGAAQPTGPHVTVRAQILPPQGRGAARLSITAEILPGWHIYSITQRPGGPRPTSIQLDESPNYRLTGPFQATPAPEIHLEKFWPGLDIEQHEGRVTWTAPLE
ncbi:MAG: hypothetical protein GTO03_02485, partial [Planctomycetales bacterium]|nr:hypothetical protein [Planctomycetales bacterium]